MCVCVCVFLSGCPSGDDTMLQICSYITTFGFFTKNEAEFFGWATNVKLGIY